MTINRPVRGDLGVICSTARTRLAGDAFLILNSLLSNNDLVLLQPTGNDDPIEITTATDSTLLAETRQVGCVRTV